VENATQSRGANGSHTLRTLRLFIRAYFVGYSVSLRNIFLSYFFRQKKYVSGP
jgi:hypothetical protein